MVRTLVAARTHLCTRSISTGRDDSNSNQAWPTPEHSHYRPQRFASNGTRMDIASAEISDSGFSTVRYGEQLDTISASIKQSSDQSEFCLCRCPGQYRLSDEWVVANTCYRESHLACEWRRC